MEKNSLHHVAIIMDGNRRWAKERNLPSIEGHLRGYEKLKKVPEWFFNRGVKIISFFAFSTENWSRTRDEVNYLMKLFEKALREDFEEFDRKKFRLIITGRLEELPGSLPQLCQETMEKTASNDKGIINICLNYGGRAEIVDAVRKIIKTGVKPEDLSEESFSKYLYNTNLPDPDMIVRTSGEYRISGFQLWESAYSELFFMRKYWPDFEEVDAEIVIKEYNKRSRSFGGDK